VVAPGIEGRAGGIQVWKKKTPQCDAMLRGVEDSLMLWEDLSYVISGVVIVRRQISLG
jgi:hypothetical protein